MGDDLLPTTTYKVVYILWRHKVTVCKECNESCTESEGLCMRPSADDHPLGSSLGLECYELVDLNYSYEVTSVMIFKSKSNGVEM